MDQRQAIDNLIQGLITLRPYMNSYTCVNEHADLLTVFQDAGPELNVSHEDYQKLIGLGWLKEKYSGSWDFPLPT